mgnify:CR=1 FL=1
MQASRLWSFYGLLLRMQSHTHSQLTTLTSAPQAWYNDEEEDSSYKVGCSNQTQRQAASQGSSRAALGFAMFLMRCDASPLYTQLTITRAEGFSTPKEST